MMRHAGDHHMTAIHREVEAARGGVHERIVARLGSGWAVMGGIQVLRGYCMLLPDPVVPHLNALTGPARTRFLDDMARLGDAVLHATGALRINYEMLGNLEPALHAHVVPRYGDEPPALRTRPVWFYDWDAAPRYHADLHGALKDAIAGALSNRRAGAGGGNIPGSPAR
jgi:diadenosine tetraphosphate (Ap4A) HIT family hydrolase